MLQPSLNSEIHGNSSVIPKSPLKQLGNKPRWFTGIAGGCRAELQAWGGGCPGSVRAQVGL